jgi:hypothetical protein
MLLCLTLCTLTCIIVGLSLYQLGLLSSVPQILTRIRAILTL